LSASLLLLLSLLLQVSPLLPVFLLLPAVFRIHDILVWIRIRGSRPLTNGSGSGCMRPKNMWIRIWIRIRIRNTGCWFSRCCWLCLHLLPLRSLLLLAGVCLLQVASLMLLWSLHLLCHCCCITAGNFAVAGYFVLGVVEVHVHVGNYDPTCQQLYEGAGNLLGFSQDGDRRIFLKNLCASPFNKDLSNDTTFSQIHLARQHL
jgi:hypothetical protein